MKKLKNMLQGNLNKMNLKNSEIDGKIKKMKCITKKRVSKKT